MILDKAKKLALMLIKKYCPEYTFKFDNAKLRFGTCNEKTKTISISKKMVEINNEIDVQDCILHEIAHALTPGMHHNNMWKKKAIEIGCNAERTHNANVIKGKYCYICPNCKHKFYMHRKLYLPSSCKYCDSKKYNEKYKLKLI
jgi:predicted SprT family Zn-dependent metalloprotease